MHYLIKRLKLVYIWYWTSDLISHYVLDTLLCFFLDWFLNETVNKSRNCVLTVILGF